MAPVPGWDGWERRLSRQWAAFLQGLCFHSCLLGPALHPWASFPPWQTATLRGNKPFLRHIGFGQCFIISIESKLGHYVTKATQSQIPRKGTASHCPHGMWLVLSLMKSGVLKACHTLPCTVHLASCDRAGWPETNSDGHIVPRPCLMRGWAFVRPHCRLAFSSVQSFVSVLSFPMIMWCVAQLTPLHLLLGNSTWHTATGTQYKHRFSLWVGNYFGYMGCSYAFARWILSLTLIHLPPSAV